MKNAFQMQIQITEAATKIVAQELFLKFKNIKAIKNCLKNAFHELSFLVKLQASASAS